MIVISSTINKIIIHMYLIFRHLTKALLITSIIVKNEHFWIHFNKAIKL